MMPDWRLIGPGNHFRRVWRSEPKARYRAAGASSGKFKRKKLTSRFS